MWPQPRRTNSRALAGTSRGRATSRSCSGQASVSGTRISPSPVNRPARMPAFTASKPGASAYARTSCSAAAYGTRSGCAIVPPSAARRPRSLRSSAGMTGRSARASARAVERLGISGCAHSPAGAIAVTDWAWPARASSSATQPPSELPATCGRSRPSASRCACSARARSRGVARAPSARHRVVAPRRRVVAPASRPASAATRRSPACRPRSRRARRPAGRAPGPTCGGRCPARGSARAAGRCRGACGRSRGGEHRGGQCGRHARDGRGLRRRAVGQPGAASERGGDVAHVADEASRQPRLQRRPGQRGGDPEPVQRDLARRQAAQRDLRRVIDRDRATSS